MRFIVELVFGHAREIFHSRLMISQPVIERSEDKVVQRRRVRHDLEETFAVFDYLRDLETVPTPFFFAEYRLGGNVEIKNPLDLASLCAASDQPDYKNYASDEHHEHG